MKQGWTEKMLKDVGKTQTGSTPSTKEKSNYGDFIPFVKPAHFQKNGSIHYCESMLSEKGLGSSRLVAENSILMVCIGATIGKTGYSEVPVTTNQQINALTPNEEYEPKYFYYAMIAQSFFRKVLQTSSQATLPIINKSKWENLTVPIPQKKQEQKRIVAKLDQAFEAIDKAKANVEHNLQNAKDLFQSELNQIFSQKGDGWVEKKLIEVNRFIDYRGRTPKKTSEGIRLITAKNVKMGHLNREPEEFINPNDYDDWMTRGIPRKNDVLFTTEAPLANVALLDTDEKIALAQRIITFMPNRDILTGEYLHYSLQSRVIQDKILEKGTGATVTGIKSRLLKEITIFIPSLDIQKRLVNSLNKMKTQSQALESNYQRELTNLDELKKSILQEAFNGELSQGE